MATFVYNLPDFDTVGFTEVTYVRDTVRAAKYITKYITKGLEDSLPGKKYLCSKGLQRATVLKTELLELEKLPELINEITGYDLELVYDTEKENIYTGGKIRYMEFKK